MINNIRTALKGSLIYSLSNAASKVIGLILMPLYMNHLSVSEYGTLGILDATSQILVAVFGLGIWYAFERWYWDENYIHDRRSVYFSVLTYSFWIGIFLVFTISLFSTPLSQILFNNGKYSGTLILMAGIAGLQILNQNPLTLLRLKNKPLLFTFISLIKLFSVLTLTIYFLSIRHKKVDGIYEAQLIAESLTFLLLLFLSYRDLEIKLNGKALKEMVIFRLPMAFSSVFVVLLSFTDRYALKFLNNLEQVGLYSVGFKLANTIKIVIVASAWYAITPLVYKMMNQKGNKRFYSKIMTYFSFGLMFFVLGLSVFGKEIVYFLSLIANNTEYQQAYQIIPIISFAIFFGMLKDVATIGLNITKKTKIIAIITMIISLINLGLNILFIPHFYFVGAAVSTLMSQLFFFILVLHFAQKAYPIPYELKKVFFIGISGLVIVLLGYKLNDIYLPLRILLKVFLIILFPVILYPLGFYEKIELLRLKGFWEKWKDPSRFWQNIKSLK